mmetsp:Transcript_49357/g.105016  ORF Transcript_49357/g.105016 Transcript_49357/m.105016 type:complete len:443 (-) Transcript_49357:346-1674(-)
MMEQSPGRCSGGDSGYGSARRAENPDGSPLQALQGAGTAGAAGGGGGLSFISRPDTARSSLFAGGGDEVKTYPQQLAARLAHLEADNTDLRQRKSLLEREIEALVGQVAQQADQLQQIPELQHKLQEAEQRSKYWEAECNRQQEEAACYREFQAQQVAISSSFSELQGIIHQLVKRVGDLDQQKQHLEGEKHSAERMITSLQEEIQRLKIGLLMGPIPGIDGEGTRPPSSGPPANSALRAARRSLGGTGGGSSASSGDDPSGQGHRFAPSGRANGHPTEPLSSQQRVAATYGFAGRTVSSSGYGKQRQGVRMEQLAGGAQPNATRLKLRSDPRVGAIAATANGANRKRSTSKGRIVPGSKLQTTDATVAGLISDIRLAETRTECQLLKQQLLTAEQSCAEAQRGQALSAEEQELARREMRQLKVQLRDVLETLSARDRPDAE